MIEKQHLYAILSGEKFNAANLPMGLLVQINDFKAKDSVAVIEPQNDLNTEGSSMLDFLQFLLSFKPDLKRVGVENIAIYHTVAYSGQCNFEHAPKILAASQKLKKTVELHL